MSPFCRCRNFDSERSVAWLVSDRRTRGLDADLSDIKAKLLHSALYYLPVLDHTTYSKQNLYLGLPGSKASFLSAASLAKPTP